MATNFHAAWTIATRFRASEMTPPLSTLDRAVTYNRPAIVHCDGDLTYTKATGVLAWSGILRVLFTREDGQAIQNTVAIGSITLADNEMAYLTLNETNNTALTMAKAAITTGAASGLLAYNRLVLAYRNTGSDELFMVALREQWRAQPVLGTIAGKDFWQGTQAQYDALGAYDANTIYFITEPDQNT